MKVSVTKEIQDRYDALIIPFMNSTILKASISGLDPLAVEAIQGALQTEKLKAIYGSQYSMNLFIKGRFLKIVLAYIGGESNTNRECFLVMAKAFKSCKESKTPVIGVLLDNISELKERLDLTEKLAELPHLVAYEFHAYKTTPVSNCMEETVFVTKIEGMEIIADEAAYVAESTMFARDLVNHPSMYMTPEKFVEIVSEQFKEEKLPVEVEAFDEGQAKELGMGAFLAVARGAVAKPRVLVMRYHGGGEEKPIGLIGKGVMFDSGGYSLKSKMATMHDDMGGAAAVIGALRAVALQRLPINVIAVVAACENMISGDAYVPGDILFSMNGKTIEMLNSDAEGRLTLVDAITYAIRKENVDSIIDIATLTGAAKGAVGGRSAAVITNNEELFDDVRRASISSCEKIWRLPADKELFDVLRSEVADLKSSSPGNTMGGGTIVAALFIQEFTEGHPWCHIDMAPVNWIADGNSYCTHGGSGYGVSLLYEMMKIQAGKCRKS